MKKTFILMITMFFVLSMIGCSSVSQEDYDSIVSERDSLIKENENLQNQIDKLKEAETSDHKTPTTTAKSLTAENIVLHFLDKISYTNGFHIWDEETDPEGLLGHRNEYTEKIEFFDKRASQLTSSLSGGSIEFFSSKDNCNARFKYLKDCDAQNSLNQYIHKYQTIILRIDGSLSEKEADEYLKALNEYLGKEPGFSYISPTLLNSPKEESSVSQEPEESTATIQTYYSGTYKVGSDIPADTYYITPSKSCYWEVASDSSGALSSIITNGNISGPTYITVEDGQYFKVNKGTFTSANDINHSLTNTVSDGMYLVGLDIAAGEYQLTPGSSSWMYVEVSSNAYHTLGSIISNDNLEAPSYITVVDGQYLEISGGTASLVE